MHWEVLLVVLKGGIQHIKRADSAATRDVKDDLVAGVKLEQDELLFDENKLLSKGLCRKLLLLSAHKFVQMLR